MSRGGIKITRSNEYESTNGKKIDWLDDFLQKYSKKQPEQPKDAVEQARARNQNFLDQISSLMGKKPTVENRVQEYHEKLGLGDYLRTVSAQDATVSSMLPSVSPELKDKVMTFLKNRVELHKGLISLPALQGELITTFKNQGLKPEEVYDPVLSKFISDALLEEKSKHPTQELGNHNLGKEDLSQDTSDGVEKDLFQILSPNKQ